MKIFSLKDVVAYQLCCGCGMCSYLWPKYIKMTDFPSYGRRPNFSENIPDDLDFRNLSISICPGYNLDNDIRKKSSKECIESLMNDWGCVLEVWEGYSSDEEIRYNGSSGGAITAICNYCIDNEEVYGVLHVCEDKNNPVLNKNVISRDKQSLIESTGSRYSPSSPCEGLELIEKSSKPSVIVGKPCDIAAINLAEKVKPSIKQKVALTISCFCAGTPSTDGTLELLKEVGVSNLTDIKSIRYRGLGWPGDFTAKVKNQVTIDVKSLSYAESWGNVLQKHRQWRCYICPDHAGEFSDISVGDPWYQKVIDGDNGRSLLVVRTDKGKKIVERAINKGYLIAKRIEPMCVPMSQPNMIKTRSFLWGRLQTLKFFKVSHPLYSGFGLNTSWNENLSRSEKLLTIIRTIIRIHKKKLRKRIFLNNFNK